MNPLNRWTVPVVGLLGLAVLGLVTIGHHAGNAPTRIRAWYTGDDRVHVAVVEARNALPGASVRTYVRVVAEGGPRVNRNCGVRRVRRPLGPEVRVPGVEAGTPRPRGW
ncbi:hypothetical protein [Methanopyrus sp.]